MSSTNIKERIKDFPRSPGVYLFKDGKGEVIYVGKARNLRSRVGSYFNISVRKGTKTYTLVENIKIVDHIDTQSELEALILEAELIKKYKPRYNIQLKDDKSYIYIIIRNEKVCIRGDDVLLPKVQTARKTNIQNKDIVFGPYPNSRDVKHLIKVIRKIIPFRDCSVSKFNKYGKLKSPCLYGHIDLCTAPCVLYDVDSIEEYKNNIRRIKNLLSSNTSKVVKDLEKKMKDYSKETRYEKAGKVRDVLNKFMYVRQTFRNPENYIDNPHLLEDIAKKSLEDIKRTLSINNNLNRIECYDISNISGKDAVGSMVVAIKGMLNKDEYRRFKIKFKNTPDDYEMMYEVLHRRLKRETNSKNNTNLKKWSVPDLIVLDGGKGQLSTIFRVLEDLDLEIPLLGLTKKNETIIFSNNAGKSFDEINLDKNNLGLNLLVNLRDESHRFAQAYHHKLRQRSLTQ